MLRTDMGKLGIVPRRSIMYELATSDEAFALSVALYYCYYFKFGCSVPRLSAREDSGPELLLTSGWCEKGLKAT